MADKKEKKVMATPRTFDVLRCPIISEKAAALAEHNGLAFQVATDATKKEIAQAVETLYKAKVKKVNIVRIQGKIKAFKGRSGARNMVKKAYVILADNQKIDVMAKL
ncbi:MAG: 50S ribosomal protein L23 [Rickettsiales bacterium]|jgi:large subunit ribosomal protein L23|nr:50S ribosomal protein L23 [Rickettsiales bacterium]